MHYNYDDKMINLEWLRTFKSVYENQSFTKAAKEETTEESPARVAIIGKPNVGKSSIVNALMSEPQRELSHPARAI